MERQPMPCSAASLCGFQLWARSNWPDRREPSNPYKPAIFSVEDVDRYASRAFYAGAVTRCPDLKGIYGADMYAPTAVQVLRTENATLRRRVKAYAAVALLGWATVVVMGVVL